MTERNIFQVVGHGAPVKIPLGYVSHKGRALVTLFYIVAAQTAWNLQPPDMLLSSHGLGIASQDFEGRESKLFQLVVLCHQFIGLLLDRLNFLVLLGAEDLLGDTHTTQPLLLLLLRLGQASI